MIILHRARADQCAWVPGTTGFCIGVLPGHESTFLKALPEIFMYTQKAASSQGWCWPWEADVGIVSLRHADHARWIEGQPGVHSQTLSASLPSKILKQIPNQTYLDLKQPVVLGGEQFHFCWVRCCSPTCSIHFNVVILSLSALPIHHPLNIKPCPKPAPLVHSAHGKGTEITSHTKGQKDNARVSGKFQSQWCYSVVPFTGAVG